MTEAAGVKLTALAIVNRQAARRLQRRKYVCTLMTALARGSELAPWRAAMAVLCKRP